MSRFEFEVVLPEIDFLCSLGALDSWVLLLQRHDGLETSGDDGLLCIIASAGRRLNGRMPVVLVVNIIFSQLLLTNVLRTKSPSIHPSIDVSNLQNYIRSLLTISLAYSFVLPIWSVDD